MHIGFRSVSICLQKYYLLEVHQKVLGVLVLGVSGLSSTSNAADVVHAIMEKIENNAANSLDCVNERYPEDSRNLRNFR